jgi:hypothetical protein
MAETLLTNEEHELIAKLGSLAADFSRVVDDDITRDADMREIVFHIHALQHMVMAQVAARAYPDLYRRLGSRIET